MSKYTLEKVLWDLSVDGTKIKAFREDRRAVLSKYRLTPDEVELVANLDVRGLADRGVTTLLTMGFFFTHSGQHSLEACVAAMQPKSKTAVNE